MTVVTVERDIAGKTLTLEAGKVANQAHGAVWVQYADTVVLATVLTAPPTRQVDFFPLYVDYRENQYAAGKVPGGFFKREGRPSTKETVTMRMIDRPCRPLFPDDFRDEVQVQCLVLSTDNQNDPDTVAMIGASAALTLSPAPFRGPIGVARIGYVDGQIVVNPTYADLEKETSRMNLVVAGPREGVNMLEMEGREIPEEVVVQGIDKGLEVCRTVIEMIDELAEKAGRECTYQPTPIPQPLLELITDKCRDRIRQAKQIRTKVERNEAVSAVRDELLAELCPEDVAEPQYPPDQVRRAFFEVEGRIQRELILQGRRPDGRGPDDIRPLTIEVGVLPRTHGSAIFARGETQSLVTATLGTPRDEQVIDGLLEEYKKKFILHYNFPPFCVGEIWPIRGPGRREIGHGALAEKSLENVFPGAEEFPYTVRVVADILESNGSTSQAAVCGGSLALMDAGVPIRAPVAGISIGMVSQDDRYVLLTDILGEEDFHGEMDFKVAGTATGITGIQLDMKARHIPHDRIAAALAKARDARLKILDAMTKILPQPRAEISRYAPRMLTLRVDVEKIGKVIGPGGKTINRIQDETGATIDVENDGTIYIASVDAEGAERAKLQILALTEDPEVGRIYTGKVVSVQSFGAFVEILPGQDGLCHVSELDEGFVRDVKDVCKIGDTLTVKVIAIDNQGRVKLSRKAAMKAEKAEVGAGQPRGGAKNRNRNRDRRKR